MLGGRRFSAKLVVDESNTSVEKVIDKEKERPELKRETWWRESLRPTPIPGSYPVRDFLEDAQLNPVKATYNFKSEGRKRMSIFQQMPDLTLPDTFSYNPPSFVELAGKRPATYSFKNTSRDYPSHLSYRDKNINLDPGQYDLFPPPVPTFPTKNYMFRSAVHRFPTFDPEMDVYLSSVLVSAFVLSKEHKKSIYVGLVLSSNQQKEGPGPGEYEIKEKPPVPIRSSFVSQVPRLSSAHTKVPGPGSYWPTRQAPKQPRTIASLGREHTIFFSNVPEL